MKPTHCCAFRVPAILLGYAILFFSGLAEAQDRPSDRLILITGGTIVSEGRATRDVSVLIQGDLIQWIGAVGSSPPLGATDTIDAAGRFVVPGFIDSHVHVGHMIGLSDEQQETLPELAEAYRRQVPRSYLYYGFTTVIDPDLRPETASAFIASPAAPTLYGCGRGIRLFEGYGPTLFPPEVRYRIFPEWTFEPEQIGQLPEGVNPLRHRPEGAVARALESGARCIKVYHEPGFGGAFDWLVPSDELLDGVSASARARALPVVLHATGLESYEAGLRADVDVLAHGLWHWPGDRLNPVPPPNVLSVINAVAERGIAVQPTLRVIAGEMDTFTWDLLDHPGMAEVLPAELLEWLGTHEGRRAQRELADLYSELIPDSTRTAHEYLAVMNERVRRFLSLANQAEVDLIFGSDTPASDGVGNPPGLNGHLEIGAWADAGVPLERVLEALTTGNARIFGLADVIGTVEVGKRADLLILREDPRVSIEAFDAIDIVVSRGQPLVRSELSARLAAP